MPVFAQHAPRPDTALSFETFLGKVISGNLQYAAEKFNVSIAEANAEAARVLPDPEISLGAFNNGEHRNKMGYGYSAEAGWTLELGGKRRARIQLAGDQAALDRALLEDFWRNLRADAAIAYLRAQKLQSMLEAQRSALSNMRQIAEADSIRFKLGSISEVDARQSRLEAAGMQNGVTQAEADLQSALIQLNTYAGLSAMDSLSLPSPQIARATRYFALDTLIAQAIANRADLAAFRLQSQAAQSALRLVKANRRIDLGVNIGATHNTVIRNEIAPTPAYTSVSAGVAIPLKFSNANKGELRAASLTVRQAETLYKAAELQIRSEVVAAWQQYQAASTQIRQFDTGMLADALRVLEGKTYSYRRGETTLLDLLNAQRTFNETRLGFIESLTGQWEALIELERATGSWNL